MTLASTASTAETITVTVRLFAGQRDIVGQRSLTCAVPAATTAGMLWEHLIAQHPRLGGYSGSIMVAVNQCYSDPGTALHDGDEVAYIPPVSGGTGDVPAAPAFHITTQPLDPAPLVRLVQTDADGAVVTFSGVARNQFQGRTSARLTYEAYAEMAVPVLQQIADEARQQHAIGRVAVHHRVGTLEIGETAVLVVVAAPHRGDAFAAAQYVMDRIKEIAPIWKREHWADGGTDWQDGQPFTA